MLEDQLVVVACGSYLPRLSLQSVRRKGLQPEVRHETDTYSFPNISLCTFNLHTSTATLWCCSVSIFPNDSIKIDLPEPGAPDRPILQGKKKENYA